MKAIKLSFLLFFYALNGCKPVDNSINETELTYLDNNKFTVITNFSVINPVTIVGKWNKTAYIDEFDTKKKNYFFYVKKEENVLGLFFKNNSVSKTNLTEKEYFNKIMKNEFKLLDKASLKYSKENSDNETYQTYVYQDYNGVNFHGLIGIRNKIVYYLTIQNEALNDMEKEKFLLDMFLTMKP